MTSETGQQSARTDWHNYFLEEAKLIATHRSKDPSTKVGCVIVDSCKIIVAKGYNGFPRGIADTKERLNDRETKYKLVVHAEMNAIANSNKSVKGCDMYVTMLPCSECMKHIITFGIKRIYAPAPTQEQVNRWGESMQFAKDMAAEAGVEVIEI